MDRSNKEMIKVPYGSMLHIPSANLLFLTAKQEPYKKAYFVTKTFEELSAKCSEEWTSRQKKKDKTERVTGLGRRTRAEIVKWNQMTALRFQTSDITGLPSTDKMKGENLGMESVLLPALRYLGQTCCGQ